MTALRFLVSAGLALVLAFPALAQTGPPASAPPGKEAALPADQPARAETGGQRDIIFSGKLYCPVKYELIIPHAVNITAIHADLGKKVKYDENLVEYEIHFDTRIDAKKKLTQGAIKELEAKMARTGRELDRLQAQRKELEASRARGMASDMALKVNAEDIEVLVKQREATAESLSLARELYLVRQDMVRRQLGLKNATARDLPKIGLIRAPIAGYVVWMNPDLHTGAYMIERTKLLEIGVMDPIILRALVHEIEAQKLRVGDEATVTFESLPEKTFRATVSRVPWVPLPATRDQPSYYEVELTMSNPDLVLKEGLKGQATILPRK